MLSQFDWLRRTRTGAELLAALRYFAEEPDLPDVPEEEVGPPPSALNPLCERCHIYARRPDRRFCATCQGILNRSWRLGDVSRHACVAWGFVNRLPRQLRDPDGFRDSHVLGVHTGDDRHFLAMFPRKEIKPWFRELAIYHGSDLRGLIQVFPTTGSPHLEMGEVICRAAHNESRFPMDRLRVRFFSSPFHVLRPHRYDDLGVLTFELTDFLSLLEMASVFRTILPPDEQGVLRKILQTDDPQEERFYWGRFMGLLDQEARDMLNAWNVRDWPKPQVQLLYDLMEYVVFYQTR
jgi:hypothetical protein